MKQVILILVVALIATGRYLGIKESYGSVMPDGGFHPPYDLPGSLILVTNGFNNNDLNSHYFRYFSLFVQGNLVHHGFAQGNFVLRAFVQGNLIFYAFLCGKSQTGISGDFAEMLSKTKGISCLHVLSS